MWQPSCRFQVGSLRILCRRLLPRDCPRWNVLRVGTGILGGLLQASLKVGTPTRRTLSALCGFVLGTWHSWDTQRDCLRVPREWGRLGALQGYSAGLCGLSWGVGTSRSQGGDSLPAASAVGTPWILCRLLYRHSWDVRRGGTLPRAEDQTGHRARRRGAWSYVAHSQQLQVKHFQKAPISSRSL